MQAVLPYCRLPMLNVYLLPSQISQIEAAALNKAVAVVIDVLRATTVITCAVHSGVRRFIPVLDIAEAERLKTQFPDGSVILGGERQGLPIPGFDLGNSPQDYTPQRVAGKTLIITTTNGTVALHAAKTAKKIIPAAFVNASAVVESLQDEDNIAIICAGTCGKETEEDTLLAGCLVERLLDRRHYRLNETGESVRRLWQKDYTSDSVAELLRQSTGGQNLIRIGLEDDIFAAAQIDTIDTVAEYEPYFAQSSGRTAGVDKA
ncbi:MAG: 2-phosphosulfolactate phosphatase [Planctomycetaceae bacterium]|jgi:2-phosphosulfolactate phosphatase|nr:2-phosphosulfolactate phosphatase [Planctomycetaceae bacterium]